MDNTDRQNFTCQNCFSGNNKSYTKEAQSGPGRTVLLVFLSCISVCAVFLNLLVIISISHFKQLHTPTNLLILSLAVADLLVGMFVMPRNIIKLTDFCWYLGKMACSVSEIINGLSVLASLCSLVLIAVDRYIAVSDPLHYPTRITVFKTSLLIFLSWSFSLLYSIIYLYFNVRFLQFQTITSCYGECVVIVKYSWVITDLIVSFLVPCSVILVLYSIVFFAARRQAKAVRAVNNPSKRNKSIRSSESKAAKTLGLVIFVYLACWIPYNVSSLSVESVTSSSMVWTVFGWLVSTSSSVNPLIYAIFYSWFRASVKYIVTCRIFKSSSSTFNLIPNNF